MADVIFFSSGVVFANAALRARKLLSSDMEVVRKNMVRLAEEKKGTTDMKASYSAQRDQNETCETLSVRSHHDFRLSLFSRPRLPVGAGLPSITLPCCVAGLKVRISVEVEITDNLKCFHIRKKVFWNDAFSRNDATTTL
jgi:hypothetical protein